jgi:hypothetical protein
MEFGSKEEWLRHSALDHSAQDRWLRDSVAALFDLAEPTAAQKRLLQMAGLHLTLMDLPDSAYPNHKAEFIALAQNEFGMPPFL